MSIQQFNSLCEGLCSLLQLPRVAPAASADGGAAIHLQRRGVTVNLMHFPQACESHAMLVFEFGAIPFDDPRAGPMLLALLDANFVLTEAAPPAFARNPVTGDVALRYALPLQDTDANRLLALVDRGVALALEWRESRFLVETAGVPGGETCEA